MANLKILLFVDFQYCYYVKNDVATARRTGWLFMVLFPFYLPLLAVIFPFVRIAIKLRQGQAAVQERLRVQVQDVGKGNCKV